MLPVCFVVLRRFLLPVVQLVVDGDFFFSACVCVFWVPVGRRLLHLSPDAAFWRSDSLVPGVDCPGWDFYGVLDDGVVGHVDGAPASALLL